MHKDTFPNRTYDDACAQRFMSYEIKFISVESSALTTECNYDLCPPEYDAITAH